MEIPLKAKYRAGGWAKKVRGKAGGDQGSGRKHHKLTDKQKRLLAPQPKMLMLMGPTGKCKMIRL